MDVQTFIAVNLMAVSAVAIVFSLIQQRPWTTGVSWVIANGVVLGVGGLALTAAPTWAGVVVAAVFCPLVAAPIVLAVLANRALQANHVRRAATLLRIGSILHPSSSARFGAVLLAAQSADSIADKVAGLRRLAFSSTPPQQAVVQASIRRIEGDWQGLLDDIRSRPATAAAIKSAEVRALGETGRLDEMVRVYDAAKGELNASDLADCQLFLLVFCGYFDAARSLIAQRFKSASQDMSVYWTAVAAGAAEAADRERSSLPATGIDWRSQLAHLARSAQNEVTRKQAERVLARPDDADRERLSGAATAIVDGIAARVRAQAVATPRPTGIAGWLARPVTLVLIALVLGGYAVEVYYGGTENLRILTELGALWPPFVLLRGEWWRLATATLLHYGPLHLGANTFMLYLLGRDTEAAFGSWRMLLIYVVGGIGSSALVLWLMANGYSDQAVLVGASGAIFALFGAIVARRLVAWLVSRDVQDLRAIMQLGVIVAIQAAIDLSVPQISFAAHAGGLIAGVLLGALLVVTDRRAPPRT